MQPIICYVGAFKRGLLKTNKEVKDGRKEN